MFSKLMTRSTNRWSSKHINILCLRSKLLHRNQSLRHNTLGSPPPPCMTDSNNFSKRIKKIQIPTISNTYRQYQIFELCYYSISITDNLSRICKNSNMMSMYLIHFYSFSKILFYHKKRIQLGKH